MIDHFEDSLVSQAGFPRIRLAFVLENLARGGPAEGCLALLRGLDLEQFAPVVHALHGGDLERDIEALGMACHVDCREVPLPNRKEQLRAEAAQRLVWQRRMVDALRADRIEAAVIGAVPQAIAVLQRAGVRVAIEKLDDPERWTALPDKSGFDRVVTGSWGDYRALVERAAEFGLDASRIACLAHSTDREPGATAESAALESAAEVTGKPVRPGAAGFETLIRECLRDKPVEARPYGPDYGGWAWPSRHGVGPARPRVLALITRYKWTHTDYLAALGRHVDLRVAVTREVHSGAVANGRRWGLEIVELGTNPDPESLTRGLEDLVTAHRPDIIHCLYYYHEAETALARRIAERVTIGERRPRIVFECRDPLTTLGAQEPNRVLLEREALRGADGWVFVSEATRSYYERFHELDLSGGLIVPHGFAERTVAPPAPKLSAVDGRLHLALVGSAVAQPDDSRYYPRIIRRLVAQGIVVHSHFHPAPEADRMHAALAEELPDYHAHPTLPHREGTVMSQAMSAYDLMGVFHELGATGRNDDRTLQVCMPTKAVCGWLSGGIPVVCFDVYRGLVEWIDAYGIGFAVSNLDEVGTLTGRRDEIGRATRRCLEHRQLFTHETQAFRLSAYYHTMLAGELPRPRS